MNAVEQAQVIEFEDISSMTVTDNNLTDPALQETLAFDHQAYLLQQLVMNLQSQETLQPAL